MSMQERIRESIIRGINEAQQQHRLMKKRYNKEKGPLRCKVSDHFEVKRRVRRVLKEEKQERRREEERQRKIIYGENTVRPVFKIDIAKLSNAKTAQIAKELSEQTKRITQQIREEQGGLFRGFRKYSSQNRAVRRQQRKAEKDRQKQDREFAKEEHRKEKIRKRIHVKSLEKRFKVEVRDERVAKYELQRKRRIARKLGYW